MFTNLLFACVMITGLLNFQDVALQAAPTQVQIVLQYETHGPNVQVQIALKGLESQLTSQFNPSVTWERSAVHISGDSVHGRIDYSASRVLVCLTLEPDLKPYAGVIRWKVDRELKARLP